MNTPFDDNANEKQRLVWACRRGMLELDVILMRFLKERFESLPHEKQQFFKELLTHPDPELYAWLMGHRETDIENLRAIIQEVRGHAGPLLF